MAGVVALVAMTVSGAETVTASTCAPVPPTGSGRTTADPACPDPATVTHRVPKAALNPGSVADEALERCPWGPASAVQSCISAASPTHAAGAPNPGIELAGGAFIELDEHGLVLGYAPFHPPQASLQTSPALPGRLPEHR